MAPAPDIVHTSIHILHDGLYYCVVLYWAISCLLLNVLYFYWRFSLLNPILSFSYVLHRDLRSSITFPLQWANNKECDSRGVGGRCVNSEGLNAVLVQEWSHLHWRTANEQGLPTGSLGKKTTRWKRGEKLFLITFSARTKQLWMLRSQTEWTARSPEIHKQSGSRGEGRRM